MLYAAYMPFIKNGGLFIPTNKSYKLGDEVFMLLNLMDERKKFRSPARSPGSPPKAPKAIGPRVSACNSTKATIPRAVESKLIWPEPEVRPSHPYDVSCSPFMLVDSHCHLDRLDLAAHDGSLDAALDAARQRGVGTFCVSASASTTPPTSKPWPNVMTTSTARWACIRWMCSRVPRQRWTGCCRNSITREWWRSAKPAWTITTSRKRQSCSRSRFACTCKRRSRPASR